MSKEQVESFLKKAHEDEALAKEFQNCFAVLQDHKDKTPKEQETLVIDRAVELGKSKGFEFEADEAHRAYRSAADQAKSELSDEELEQVAGGKSTFDKGMAISSWATLGAACAVASAVVASTDALAKDKPHEMKHCMGPMTGGDGFASA